MGYMIILLVVCIMSQVNGHRIWTSTVREAQPVLSSSTKGNDPQPAAFSGATVATPMLQQVPQVMTPQSQYPYPPVSPSVSPLYPLFLPARFKTLDRPALLLLSRLLLLLFLPARFKTLVYPASSICHILC